MGQPTQTDVSGAGSKRTIPVAGFLLEKCQTQAEISNC